MRTVERYTVADGNITELDDHQLGTSALKSNPEAIWWLKGDGADIVPGLHESVHRQWYGDADLDDGALQEMYQAQLNLLS